MKIQFYLNEILTETLKSKGLEGESPHLTAKRLMEDLLKGEVVPSSIAPSLDDLAEISDRLSALEGHGGLSTLDLDLVTKEVLSRLDIHSRLIKLGDRLTALETIAPITPDQIAELSDRLNALENSGYWEINTGDRLAALTNRLNQMELFLSDRPTGSTSKNIPQGLTHKEMAAQIGGSERTMQRMAKDRERWPEGFLWSDESKKWFPN